MAKDNDDKPAKSDAKALRLDRAYIHSGRIYYPGEVTIGTGGPEAGEIDEQGFADLKNAIARTEKRDADIEAAKLAIDERADAVAVQHGLPKKK